MIKSFSLCAVLLVASTDVLALTPVELKQVNNAIQILKKKITAHKLLLKLIIHLNVPNRFQQSKIRAEMSTRFEQVFDQALSIKLPTRNLLNGVMLVGAGLC